MKIPIFTERPLWIWPLKPFIFTHATPLTPDEMISSTYYIDRGCTSWRLRCCGIQSPNNFISQTCGDCRERSFSWCGVSEWWISIRPMYTGSSIISSDGGNIKHCLHHYLFLYIRLWYIWTLEVIFARGQWSHQIMESRQMEVT